MCVHVFVATAQSLCTHQATAVVYTYVHTYRYTNAPHLHISLMYFAAFQIKLSTNVQIQRRWIVFAIILLKNYTRLELEVAENARHTHTHMQKYYAASVFMLMMIRKTRKTLAHMECLTVQPTPKTPNLHMPHTYLHINIHMYTHTY